MGTSKIINITKVKCEPTKVFDITVSKNHNFILNNGLVVHNCVPYQYLRSCIYEKRFIMYKSERLFDECIDIERNLNTGKVDHTPNYHKDVLDAVCGAVFNASKHAEEYAKDYGEDLNLVTQISGDSDKFTKEQINLDFEQELTKMYGNINSPEPKEKQDENTTKFMDFGMGEAKPYFGNYLANGIIVF